MKGTVLFATDSSPNNVTTRDEMPNRTHSRVSTLRDMFQTGAVRPVEEIEDILVTKADICDAKYVPRYFPGSPPLKSVRNHVSGLNTSGATLKASMDINQSTSTCTTSKPVASSALPPERPPKPRNINLTKLQSRNKINLKVDGKLQSTDRVNVGAKSWNDTKRNLKHVEQNDSDTDHTRIVYTSEHASDEILSTVNKNDVHAKSGNTTTDVTTKSKSSLVKSLARELDSKHVSTTAPLPMKDYHNFVVQPEAFHSNVIKDQSSVLQHAERVAIEGTPEGDEDTETSTNSCRVVNQASMPVKIESPVLTSEIHQQNVLSNSPLFSKFTNIPISRKLNIVAVDKDGTHILQDGNFFYALPGLNDNCLDDDSDFHSYHEPLDATNDNHVLVNKFLNDNSIQQQSSDKQSPKTLFPHSKSSINNSVMNDEGYDHPMIKQPSIRFSNEPILVFSTFSTTDYDRRNEDIDPLVSSAEYELEKSLENMEWIEIEFQKDDNGLGINTIGSYSDTDIGVQKLCIFIKSIKPGSAAEADGRLQMYDQIVQVDGHSLVGVTREFAAQVFQSTEKLVHFVIARDKDPNNSRIAKIIREQEDETKAAESASDAASVGCTGQGKISDVVTGSKEAISSSIDADRLHNLIAMATCTAKQSNDDVDDEEQDNDDVDMDDVDVVMGDYRWDVGDSKQQINYFDGSDEDMEYIQFSNSYQTLNDITPLNLSNQPRSALKGTANAASTRRRNASIIRYIQHTFSNADKATVPVEYASFIQDSNINLSSLDRLCWILASEVFDCRNKIIKFHSHIRNLEQRLTVQEATAEEAIERLCMQCQHLESELSEFRAESMALNNHITFTSESEMSMQVNHNQTVPDSVMYETMEISTTDVSTQTTLSWEQLESQHLVTVVPSVDKITLATQQMSNNLYADTQFESYDEADNKTDFTQLTSPDLQWCIRQLQDRTKLINNGTLAGRRLPSRLVAPILLCSVICAINTLYYLFSRFRLQIISILGHNKFYSPLANMEQDIVQCARQTTQLNNTIKNLGGDSSDSFVQTQSPKSVASTQSTPHSNNSKMTNESIEITHQLPGGRKIVGHQLPGLFDASQTVLRRSTGNVHLSKLQAADSVDR